MRLTWSRALLTKTFVDANSRSIRLSEYVRSIPSRSRQVLVPASQRTACRFGLTEREGAQGVPALVNRSKSAMPPSQAGRIAHGTAAVHYAAPSVICAQRLIVADVGKTGRMNSRQAGC
jgi:hypothetical protein